MPDEGWGDETVRGAQVVTTPGQQALLKMGQILGELRELREILQRIELRTRMSGLDLLP